MSVSLQKLNTMSPADFVQQIGWVFEGSPWVAGRAAPSRPFDSLGDLHQCMVVQVFGASEAEQLALIRAHPDLGARAQMAEASVAEQQGAGLDRLSPGEFARLHELNTAYKAKFDFPFILAVRGKDKHDILAGIEERLSNTPGEERHRALSEIATIAGLRLADAVEDA